MSCSATAPIRIPRPSWPRRSSRRALSRRPPGVELALVGSVCGTADPQGLARQEEALRAAGVLLAESNAQAVRLAATVAAGRRGQVNLFQEQLEVVNVGLPAFADAVRSAGGAALQVEWAPPGSGDPDAARRLAGMINHAAIEAANRQAFAAYQAAQPVLEGIGIAGASCPASASAPSCTRVRRSRGSGCAVRCRARSSAPSCTRAGRAVMRTRRRWPRAARSSSRRVTTMVRSGRWRRDQSFDAGLDRARPRARQAGVLFNEGLGKVLRFGANSPEVLERLRWLAAVLAPALAAALEVGGVELKPLIAQALHMGDEVHNRNVAASSLLLKRLAPALLRTDTAPGEVAAVMEVIAGNDHFFLNLSMAACKAMLDAAADVPNSSMVTAMSRNGVDFGIRLSGTGEAWFTAPAPVVEGLFFPGYTAADAAPDLGDSAITETAGLGGFAMAAAPAIVQFVGGTPQDAIANTDEMSHITLGRNGALTLPALDFAGTPAGIDARKVVDTAPIINTGIAHREAGIGQIAGITRSAGVLRQGDRRAGRPGGGLSRAREGRTMPFSDRTAVVAVGGNLLILDREHESIRISRKAAGHRASHRRHGRRRLERRDHARQRPAGGIHPAALGSRSARCRRCRWTMPPPTCRARSVTCSSALRNEFRRRGLQRSAIAVVTQVLVDRNDPAFADPAKPIGSHMDEETARRRAAELGWIVREDAGRGWRRVVPSPLPQGIVEIDEIEHLVSAGYVVIACGGGGIPVFQGDDGDLQGVEAVIDKDLASSMLARELNAALFVISTGVPGWRSISAARISAGWSS